MTERVQSPSADHNARGVWLFEQGRLDEAIECFREATRLDHSRAAPHYNLGNALVAAGCSAEACTAYRSAVAIDRHFSAGHRNLGLALLEEDDVDGAVHALRRAVELDPLGTEAASSLAIALLRRGDLRDALAALERNLARMPNETRDLALKAVALERIGDVDGAHALLDFDRLILTSRPAAPPGYRDVAAFNAALAQHVLDHPSLDCSPSQHATRGGRHSGDLLLDCAPVIVALESVIESAVQRYVETGARTGAHPFLATAPDSVVLTAWAVVLERGGYQIPHVHPAGWLSGVYYVRVPEPPPRRPRDGCIEFGRPDPALVGSAETATRLVRPEPGSMVLFPSYFYHCTLPFDSPGPRISIAFDVMANASAGSA